MLQQTRTETVKGYYERFLNAFPDVFSLADAPEAKVLKMWEGLGYYSRARNLHAAAKLVALNMNGEFPSTFDGLKKLPGIGDYAAGAISSMAFDRREPALDGNQARVIARIFNITHVVKTPSDLRREAMLLMPDEQFGEYNQALMGLGAMVCTSGKPKCDVCPVSAFCDALAFGKPEALPVKPEKAQKKKECRAVALVYSPNGVMVQKRAKGLLKGLWEFPGFTDARCMEDVVECLKEMGVIAKPIAELAEHIHVFTHLEWHMKGYTLKFESGCAAFADKDGLNEIAMPTALKPYREEALRMLKEPDK